MYLKTTGLVAQPVERWTPCGGSIRPGYESSGFEARRALDIYVIPGGYGRGKWAMASRSQSKSVMGPAARGYMRTLEETVHLPNMLFYLR